MWEVGPFQEHSVSSFPKMLSLDHTAARSDLDKAGPEGGCSPHSAKGLSWTFLPLASRITFLGYNGYDSPRC